ncbi:hypothetical protein QS257_21415 [Terrilactibacillus sp. S3-3]|nr:hypothetical protein QS257_21415 [Terrilactibacillus sp. S3-3]
MLAGSGTSWPHYITSFGPMIQMVMLFAVIPILALPIRLGEYAHEVRGLIERKVKNENQLYMLTSGLSYFFSSFMNLAALPMTYYSISPAVSGFSVNNQERYLSRSITHGYAMPLLWSPITPIVGTVLGLTAISYTRVLPYLLLLSIGGLALDWTAGTLLFKPGRKRKMSRSQNETSAAREQNSRFHPARLLHILVAVLLLNALITLFDRFFKLDFMFLVSLLVIPFSFIWCLFIHKGRPFLQSVGHHFQTYWSKMQNQFFIFLSAGFFITALHVSRADTILNQWVEALIHFIGIQAFLIMLPLFPFALAFIGLHPAVGLALISEAIHADLLTQCPIVVTIAMLGGAIPAFLMGPYNATLGMMASIVDEKPFKLSNWNLTFTFFYLILLTVFVQLLYFIL